MNRGGRGLIPVFALGRAQELLLILGAPFVFTGRFSEPGGPGLGQVILLFWALCLRLKSGLGPGVRVRVSGGNSGWPAPASVRGVPFWLPSASEGKNVLPFGPPVPLLGSK